MPIRTGWTREQLLLALRLYMRLPFGQLDQRNAEVIELARRIGRTPSAVAMKACNFASLDPAFLSSGRKGLSGASATDRAVWQEFTENPEKLAAQSEAAFAAHTPAGFRRRAEPSHAPEGDTDVLRTVRARRVQSFFRAAVLTSYERRCAISGLAVPGLLVASHIMPWSVSVERRADPRNGICLNALFDKAFDRGLITLDDQHRVVVSAQLRHAAESADLECSLRDAHGRAIRMPTRLAPDVAALEFHRTKIFLR